MVPRALSALEKARTAGPAAGCLVLCPWPWHSTGPGWVPNGCSVDTGQVNGCVRGSLGVSAHTGIGVWQGGCGDNRGVSLVLTSWVS